MPLKKTAEKKKTAPKKAAKPAKKIVKKAAKKPAQKPTPKAAPVFKEKNLVLWNGPEMPEALPRGFATMNNLDLRYAATLMKQLAADIELMIEARTLPDHTYEHTISDNAQMKLDDILTLLRNLNVAR
jgi:hypothetical protein